MILTDIQKKLKAPKNRINKFGGFKYRSCEDILEGVKPILSELNAAVIISDDIALIGARYYVKATAALVDADGKEIAKATAYAREGDDKKGMDVAQVTGSASSYARKYALNGLFAIDDDDSRDPDTQAPETAKTPAKTQAAKPATNPYAQKLMSDHIVRINAANTEDDLVKVCGDIKTELGSSYAQYAADVVAHYKRRAAEIKKELGGAK